MVKEEISLTTEDGIRIVGTYCFDNVSCDKSVLLLHMLRRDRSVWDNLVSKLTLAGFCTLAIDFRGHGASFGDWRGFQAQDYLKMKFDVQASFDFLRSKNPQTQISIVGASIGANHALRFASSTISALVLLSPGIDYHGVTTEDYITRYKGPIFLVAAQDDEYAFSSTNTLYQKSLSAIKKLEVYELGGHGTEMFKSHPDLEEKIVDFLKQNVK